MDKAGMIGLGIWLALLAAWPLGAQAAGMTDLRQGYNCLRLADYQCAIRNLDAAIAGGDLGAKDLGLAHRLRGDAWRYLKRFDRALSDYTSSLDIFIRERYPQEAARTYSQRGLAYYRKGHYDQALADYNRALKGLPNDSVTLYRRGNAHRLRGDYKKALADFSRSLRLRPDAVVYDQRAQAYAHLDRLQEAIADQKMAVKMRPDKRIYRIRLEQLKQRAER